MYPQYATMFLTKLLHKLFVLSILSFLSAMPLWAGEAATLVNLIGGKVTLIKANKQTVELKLKDKIEEGDTVVTGKDTFAMFKFTDNAETILRPETEFKVIEHKFVSDDPSKDKTTSQLVNGGLRRLTGLCGKRGNPEVDKLVTATATVGIRGTIYDVMSCAGGAGCAKLENGTYFKVKDGEITIKNDAGEISISKGQFAQVATPTSKPVILPKDPGFPNMTPPKSMQLQNQDGSQCAA
jgi:hypothetical protein